MDETVRMRALTAADADPVAALVRLAFAAQSVPTDPPASALQLSAAEVAAHLVAGGAGVVAVASDRPAAAGDLPGGVAGDRPGAVASQRPVGSAMWSEQAGGLYLARLAIHPAWRRRGLARALIVAAEAAARAQHLPRLHLGTRLVLADNRRLFAACGFVEVARHAHPGYVEPTWVEMEKRLD